MAQAQGGMESASNQGMTETLSNEMALFLAKKRFVCSYCGEDRAELLERITERTVICEECAKEKYGY
jgi:formylmethanofuran dehydrogenase subunit E